MHRRWHHTVRAPMGKTLVCKAHASPCLATNMPDMTNMLRAYPYSCHKSRAPSVNLPRPCQSALKKQKQKSKNSKQKKRELTRPCQRASQACDNCVDTPPYARQSIRKARRRAQTRRSASQTLSALPELSGRSSAVSCGASVHRPVSMSQTSMNSPSTSGIRSCAGTTPFSVSTCVVPSPRICSTPQHATVRLTISTKGKKR